VARVVVAPAAAEDLDTIIATRHLPPDTKSRVRAILVYALDEEAGLVTVATVQDTRSAIAATGQR
jgi:hypothetical protein